jgi:CBS domain-containing protein
MTPDPACCVPRDSVVTAAMLMRSQNIGSIPVVSDHDSRKVIGMVTDRDLAMRVIAEQREYYSTHVGDVMSKDVVTCQTDDDYDEVLDAMEKHQVRRIPVVDSEKRLVGIIAQADVARESKDREEVGHVVEHISEPGGGSRREIETAAGSGGSGLKTGLLVAGGLGIGAGLIFALNPSWARRARESVTSAAGNMRDTMSQTAQRVQDSVSSAAESLRDTVGQMTGGGMGQHSNTPQQRSGD